MTATETVLGVVAVVAWALERWHTEREWRAVLKYHADERSRLIGHLTSRAMSATADISDPPARVYGTDEDEWQIEQERRKRSGDSDTL